MPKNHRLLTISTAMFSSLTMALTINIQPSSSSPTSLCQDAVQSVRSQIQTGRNLEILPTIKRNVSTGYSDAPIGRPDEYVIPLRGAESLNILNSPQMMTTLARRIISQCDNASLVTFGIANSGNIVSLGLMPNGSISVFNCIEPGLGLRPRWGQIVCT
jgi:hypothetical protein